MTKFNLTLCKELIKQTRSIDETARPMSDFARSSQGFIYWKRQVSKSIFNGDIVL